MPVPERWLEYKPLGRTIEGTSFVCFKVPLRESIKVDQNETWTIKKLLEELPDLGAVIDLTNTAKYYDSRSFTSQGVLHTKILMPGRILPPEDKVREFMDIVDDYLKQNLLIGIHCTHGLNRTGYMVCRYMRDRMGVPGNEAIKKFEKARGHPMERKVYIDDLLSERKRHSSKKEASTQGATKCNGRLSRPRERESNKRYSFGKKGSGNESNWRSRNSDSNSDSIVSTDDNWTYDYRHDY